jgi:quercetin dioxygenase-like cupin family protein
MKTHYKLAVAAILAAALFGQNPGFKRTVVERADVSVPGREAVITHVEINPGVSVGRHTHPGEEISYVIEGEGELLIEGQPARKLKAGDGFIVPAGAKHDARNTGTTELKLAAISLVEKGTPIATPAP